MTTQLNPLAYAITLGTSSVQVLPSNPSRRGLIFFNASSNLVSVIPAVDNTGRPTTAIVNGPGCIAVVPGGGALILPQPGWTDAGIGAAFNAIASAPMTAFTIWEF
jgi:hypothetical protein